MDEKFVNDTRTDPRQRAEWMVLMGERLCLDFVNSPNWHGDTALDDPFQSADGFRVWAMRAIGDGGGSGACRLDIARRLRSDMRSVLLACIEGRAVPTEAMTHLAEIASQADGLEYRWEKGEVIVTAAGDDGVAPVAVLAARSALELLMSTDRALLKTCGGDRCGWIFLDRTRGLIRKWCMMRTCGNRAKAKAHYTKKRRAESRAPDAPKRRPRGSG